MRIAITGSTGLIGSALSKELREQGHDLNKGAVLMDGARVWHGSEAIAVLCRQLTPTPCCRCSTGRPK